MRIQSLAEVRFVSAQELTSGIKRVKCGPKGFSYRSASGQAVKNRADLQRIKSLVIPPAWTDVRICVDPAGHIQAVGRDAKGRKQYRYHAEWRQRCEEAKYQGIEGFALALPKLRQAVDRHMKLPGFSREKVLATVVYLLETTLIRVGNDEYATNNKSYGLTTLQSRHVDVNKSNVRFRFRGKSGKEHDIQITDPKVAKILKKMEDLPGQDLFVYQEDGEWFDVKSDHVNEYIRTYAGPGFSAKCFRTWTATVLAAMTLHEIGPAESQTEAKRKLVVAVERVSKLLGNTKTICRKSYVHPAIIEAYLRGELCEHLESQINSKLRRKASGLRPEEIQVLWLLQKVLRVQNGKSKRSLEVAKAA